MTAPDFFYISFGIGIWILIAIMGYLSYQVYKLITSLHKILEELNLEYKTVKSGLKLGALSLLTKFLGKKKGGGKNK